MYTTSQNENNLWFLDKILKWILLRKNEFELEWTRNSERPKNTESTYIFETQN